MKLIPHRIRCRLYRGIVLVMMGLLLPLAARGELVDRIVAVVNDDIILLSELEEAEQLVRASLEQQGYTQAQQDQILHEQRSNILQRMVDDKLTDQQVVRHNIRIDDAEEEATIQRIMAVNHMTEADLKRQLQLTGTSYEDYRKEIRNRILRARLLSREVQSKIVITDSDIKSYYDSHPDQYASIIKYDLRHILLHVSPGMGQLEKARIFQQAHELHGRLENGESFEQLARLYSQAGSASKGGHLGVYGASVLTARVREALKGLGEKQFTDVLETEQGYQIFYIEQILKSGGKSIEEATPEIQEKLYADVVDAKFRSWLEELRNRSHIEIMQ